MTNAVTYTDFINMIPAGFNGYVLAQLTDEYLVDCWPQEKDGLAGKEAKLLELRVFNPEAEYKLFRSRMGASFKARCIDDSLAEPKRDYFDQEQYLDIDTVRSEETREQGKVVTTGGGEYRLPLRFADLQEAKIWIRYYFDQYESTGQAKIADWRVVEFVGGKNTSQTEEEKK